MQDETNNRKVYVTNISPSASEKTVTDFFSFCGKIESLSLRTLEGGVKEATIEFQTDAAAKTALLLTNALIVDRPITVTQGSGPEREVKESPVTHESNVSGDEIINKEHALPDEQRTQTSVIASLIAAGYKVGADAIEKARVYDETHHLSQRFMAQTEAFVQKAQQLDSEYHISETAASWKSAAADWWSGVDSQYGISQRAAAVKESGSAALKKVGESEVVQVAGETLSTAGQAIASAGTTLKEEMSRMIDEQPSVKAAATRVQEGAGMVGSQIKGVVDETNRLISENKGESGTSPQEAQPHTEPQPTQQQDHNV